MIRAQILESGWVLRPLERYQAEVTYVVRQNPFHSSQSKDKNIVFLCIMTRDNTAPLRICACFIIVFCPVLCRELGQCGSKIRNPLGIQPQAAVEDC